jgi:hypothetical protein
MLRHAADQMPVADARTEISRPWRCYAIRLES